MANIAFYGSHNSAVAVERDGKVLEVIEIERFINKKNIGYGQYFVSMSRDTLLYDILNYIKDKYGIEEYDICYYLNSDTIDNEVKTFHHKKIPAKHYIEAKHHESHAACGLYQSTYNKALIISFDGGGNDGFFNIYYANNRLFTLIDKHNLDLGFPYMVFGQYLDDIKLEPSLSIGNLVYSGKIMGLCSYGNVNKEWLPHFIEFYKSKPDGNNYIELLSQLGEKTGLKFNTGDRLKGQQGYDVAMTSQEAFESVFFELINPYLNKYQEPVILVGGCALNIILNTKLRERVETFVPPNPNDCGIAAGMILNHIKPLDAIDLTYSGTEVLDKYTLSTIIEEYKGKKYNTKEVANLINKGKIIGVVRDRAEHGPRALGNRSILCNPTIKDMKDILNIKVKHREFYRPFAPVVRLEDISEYFEFEGESRHMSFCPKVKDKYKNILPAITHIDGTARVQTVTKEQNEWLYNLLGELDTPVLLNTSFNVNGKPLVSTYQEALHVYNTTDMDNLILQDYII